MRLKRLHPRAITERSHSHFEQKIGALNTYGFLAQIGQNQEDYVELQERMCNGQNIDQLYRTAKQHWQERNRRK